MGITLPVTVTIPELARISGKNPSFLARRAKELGYDKSGRDYQLTRQQARKLLSSIRASQGNPNFGKKFGNGKRTAAAT